MENLEEEKSKELAAAINRLKKIELNECFDPFDAKSKPTAKQKEVLRETHKYYAQYVSGGNQSGKSLLGGRVTSWFYKRSHPYFDLEAMWPDEPILILVCGRVSKQVEELWDKKIKPFLLPQEYREHRIGGYLSSVVNPLNGSKIIFLTHHNTNEAREKAQSYVAHLFWFDELTDSLNLIEECQRRVQAKKGRFLMTFTPKLRAPAVKDFIEAETPTSKRYKISMMDNPIYKDRYQELMDQVQNLPEDLRNSVLFGSWYVGENAVFHFDFKEHVVDLDRVGYQYSWPHIVSVDPAASGLMGYTLWAAPYSNAETWYCVDSEYFKGIAPSAMIDKVESRIAKYPIIKRITDPHEAWFVKEAWKSKNVSYIGVPNKQHRKKDLIVAVNEQLGNRILISSECKSVIDELSSAQWSETSPDKIVNAHNYHLSDCVQYFVDMMPPHKEVDTIPVSYDSQLRAANKARQLNEYLRQKKAGPKKISWISARRKRNRWKQSYTRAF